MEEIYCMKEIEKYSKVKSKKSKQIDEFKDLMKKSSGFYLNQNLLYHF